MVTTPTTLWTPWAKPNPLQKIRKWWKGFHPAVLPYTKNGFPFVNGGSPVSGDSGCTCCCENCIYCTDGVPKTGTITIEGVNVCGCYVGQVAITGSPNGTFDLICIQPDAGPSCGWGMTTNTGPMSGAYYAFPAPGAGCGSGGVITQLPWFTITAYIQGPTGGAAPGTFRSFLVYVSISEFAWANGATEIVDIACFGAGGGGGCFNLDNMDSTCIGYSLSLTNRTDSGCGLRNIAGYGGTCTLSL